MAATTTALIMGGLALVKGASDFSNLGSEARTARSEGNYAADIYGRNADLADRQAEDAIARGAESEQAIRRKSRGLIGSQRAAFGAQGIDIGSGSANDVIQNDEALGELDALTIRNNAQREAYGYRTQASIDRRQGALAQQAGRNRASALKRGQLGTLLTTTTSIAGSYESKLKPTASRYTASGHPRGGAL